MTEYTCENNWLTKNDDDNFYRLIEWIIFKGDLVESKQTKVSINNIDSQTMKSIIDYSYTSHLGENFFNFINLNLKI